MMLLKRLKKHKGPFGIVIMGVAGCGKTTIGELLAERLDIPFFDADDFHPEANKVKMSSGTPLTDEDRAGWLQNLHILLSEHLSHGQSVVLACSALKASYRDTLRGKENDLLFVHLEGSFEEIEARMKNREHFMPPSLLQSQFDTLEPPAEGLTLSIADTPGAIVAKIIAYLKK